MDWNEEWGKPEDFNIVEGVTELAGFKVGDNVVVIEDTPDEMHFTDDEGVIIGISHTEPGKFNPYPRDELVVAWDGYDPSGIDPAYVEQF